LRFNWERRLTKGNMKQPMITSSCQFPLRVKRNQSLASGRNMERQRWRIAIPARPSVTSVIRLNKAWPLNVSESLWKPDLSDEELFEVVSQCLLSAVDRDATSGWGAVVHVISKDKITTRQLAGRQD